MHSDIKFSKEVVDNVAEKIGNMKSVAELLSHLDKVAEYTYDHTQASLEMEVDFIDEISAEGEDALTELCYNWAAAYDGTIAWLAVSRQLALNIMTTGGDATDKELLSLVINDIKAMTKREGEKDAV